jgi:hypothetical protein
VRELGLDHGINYSGSNFVDIDSETHRAVAAGDQVPGDVLGAVPVDSGDENRGAVGGEDLGLSLPTPTPRRSRSRLSRSD